eukprot:3859270-Pleurochrysis_carterae.AAC.1
MYHDMNMCWALLLAIGIAYWCCPSVLDSARAASGSALDTVPCKSCRTKVKRHDYHRQVCQRTSTRPRKEEAHCVAWEMRPNCKCELYFAAKYSKIAQRLEHARNCADDVLSSRLSSMAHIASGTFEISRAKSSNDRVAVAKL